MIEPVKIFCVKDLYGSIIVAPNSHERIYPVGETLLSIKCEFRKMKQICLQCTDTINTKKTHHIGEGQRERLHCMQQKEFSMGFISFLGNNRIDSHN